MNSELMLFPLKIIHPECVLRLRFRETKGSSLQDADSQELSIVMPGVIARIDGSDLQVSSFPL